MSKILKCLLSALLVVLATSCRNTRATSLPQHRLNSLLYSGYNANIRQAIVQLDPATGKSQPWIATENVGYPSRSPDGKRVAYFAEEGAEDYNLWLADADGQEARQVGGPYPFHSGRVVAEWSFDSRYIAFRTTSGDNSAWVRVLDVTTSQVITTTGGWDFAWSPTANQMAVYGGSGLWVLDISTGSERGILDVFIPNFGMDWTADGRTIVFSAHTKSLVDGGYVVDRSLDGVYAVDKDGSNFRELTRDTAQYTSRSIGGIQVSPDGNHLFFISNFRTKEGVDGIATLMIMDLKSGQVRQVASGLSGPSTWSPDSTRFVFGGTEDAQGNRVGHSWELFMYSISDGTIKRLTYNDAAPGAVTW